MRDFDTSPVHVLRLSRHVGGFSPLARRISSQCSGKGRPIPVASLGRIFLPRAADVGRRVAAYISSIAYGYVSPKTNTHTHTARTYSHARLVLFLRLFFHLLPLFSHICERLRKILDGSSHTDVQDIKLYFKFVTWLYIVHIFYFFLTQEIFYSR